MLLKQKEVNLFLINQGYDICFYAIRVDLMKIAMQVQEGNAKKRATNVSELLVNNGMLGKNDDWRGLDPSAGLGRTPPMMRGNRG